MSARDEPSYLAFARADVRNGHSTSPGAVRELIARIDRDAKALKAAQPRAVTTAEELDALAEGAVILSNDGEDSAQKDGEGYWYLWGGDIGLTPEEINLPATVLHDPEAQS